VQGGFPGVVGCELVTASSCLKLLVSSFARGIPAFLRVAGNFEDRVVETGEKDWHCFRCDSASSITSVV